MADGPTGPDFAAMLSLINASKAPSGGQGISPLLGCVLSGGARDVDCGAPLSAKAGAPKDQPLPTLQPTRPASFPGAKLLASMGFTSENFIEGFKKANEGGALRQSPVQQVSIDQITGSGLSRNVAGSAGNGGIDIG